MKYIIFIFFIIFLSNQTLTLLNTSITPSYAGVSNATYTFNLLVQNQIIASGYQFIIVFPTQSFNITTVYNYEFNIDQTNVTTINYSVNSNQIIFSNLITTIVPISPTNITIIINTNACLYQTNPILSMYFLDASGNQISTTFIQAVLSISVAQALACSITSNSAVTGVTTSWVVSYNPLVPILVGQNFKIILPLWGINSTSNFVNSTPICSGMTCSASIVNSNEQLLITNYFNQTTTSSFQINVSGIKNPINTAPISLQFNILSSENLVQTCINTFTANIPNSFKSISFNNSNNNISVNNSIVLTFVINNPLSTTSYLKIATTLPITYNYVQITTNKPILVNGTTNLLLQNITSTKLNSGSVILIGNFILTNPPYSNIAIPVTFSTQTLINGTYYNIDSSTVYISSAPSQITQYTFTTTNLTVNVISSYLINFTNINQLFANSIIMIVFPSETKLFANSTCISSYASCNIFTANNTILITTGIIIPVQSTISVNITNVNNPPTTLQTSSFQIYTYYSSNFELIDNLTSGMTITAVPIQIKILSVSSNSYVVMKSSVQYNCSIQCNNPIPVGTIFNISFPTELGITLIQYSPLNILPCDMNVTGNIVILKNCIKSIVQSSFVLIFQGITNPLSTKPTSTFNLTTYYNNTLLQYQTASVTIQMTTPAVMSVFSISTNNSIVNALSTYTFLFTFNTIHYSGDRIYLVFPSQILIGSGFQCILISGISFLNCIQVNSTTLIITMTFTVFPINYQISFNITNFYNNWVSTNSIIQCYTTTNDTILYYVESGSYSLAFVPTILTISTISNQDIVLLGNSTINTNITSPFILSRAPDTTLSYLTVSFPSTSFTALASNCTISFGSCIYSSSLNGYNLTNIGTFSSVLINQFYVYTQYFNNGISNSITAVLFYNGSVIASGSFSVTSFCISPCKQCTSTPTQCLSCLPSPFTLNNTYLPNNTCTQNCPNGTFYNSTTFSCQNCQGNCSTCTINGTNCLSCVIGTYFLNNICYSTCPNYYYSANSYCQSCVSPCLLCNSNTSCISCVATFLYYQNTCSLSCIDLTTIPLNGMCVSCSGVCYTCSVLVTNCTSCKSNLILYNYNCLTSCPLGTYLSINTCVNCISPCVTCTTNFNCVTCISGTYLYLTSCISTCPSGTLASTTQCQPCSAQCLTCLGIINNCTSCGSNLYYINNTCVTNCTPPYYPYQNTCVQCIPPCLSCQSTPVNCSACITNYYIFGYSCVSSCPQNYYLQNSTLSCVSCSQNCIICTSLSNCSTCLTTLYLYDGLCYNSCPLSSPIIIGQTCNSCSSQCLTCYNIQSNCTSCSQNMYQYKSTCLKICPSGMYGDSATNLCKTIVITYIIIFFPFTIILIISVLIILFSKLYSSSTVIITSLTSISSILQIGSWAYYLSSIFNNSQNAFNNNLVPICLVLVGFGFNLLLNLIFYIRNTKTVKDDNYFIYWIKNGNTNYYTYMTFIHVSLFFNLKFYRILYSRLFNLIPLSMIFTTNKSIFPLTTAMTILHLILCEIPVVISSIAIAYFKVAKDQLFYNSIDCIIVTGVCAILGILDIYKEEQFFSQSAFFKLKEYILNIKDSMQKQKDQIQLNGATMNLESQNFIHNSNTNKKTFLRSKFQIGSEENSYNNIYGNSHDEYNSSDHHTSQLIEFIQQTPQKNLTGKKHKRINIFEAVLQQQAEYELQYSLESIQKIILSPRPKSEDNNENIQESEIKNEQLEKDTKSLLEHKLLKKEWNKIIRQRKQKAKRLYKNISIQTVDLIQEKNETQQQKQEKQMIKVEQYKLIEIQSRQELDLSLQKQLQQQQNILPLQQESKLENEQQKTKQQIQRDSKIKTQRQRQQKEKRLRKQIQEQQRIIEQKKKQQQQLRIMIQKQKKEQEQLQKRIQIQKNQQQALRMTQLEQQKLLILQKKRQEEQKILKQIEAKVQQTKLAQKKVQQERLRQRRLDEQKAEYLRKQKIKQERQQLNKKKLEQQRLQHQRLQQILENLEKEKLQQEKRKKDDMFKELPFQKQSDNDKQDLKAIQFSDNNHYEYDAKKNSELIIENEQLMPQYYKQLNDSSYLKKTKKTGLVLNESMKKVSDIYLQRLKAPEESKKNSGISNSKVRRSIKKQKKINLDF